MKTLIKIRLLIALAMGLYACKKSDISIPQSATINVTNAVVGGSSLALNIDLQTIANNGYGKYLLFAGTSPGELIYLTCYSYCNCRCYTISDLL